MKIALVHDYIKEYGGAERVLEALHEIWPKAPVFTTVYLPEFLGPHKKRFEKWDVRVSLLQHLPYKAKLVSPLRLVAPFVFRTMDFSKYDAVIVSATGAYQPNLIKKGKVIHICYCHTPPRHLYGYPTARSLDKYSLLKPFIHVMNHILRMVDYKSAQNVDYFVANSKEIATRIKKFYRKDAVVIHPPIDIPRVKKIVPIGKRKYYLTGGRLARAKRFDLAVKVCTKMNLPLKVFGKSFAGYGEELKKMAADNVEFLGEVSEKKKWELIKSAKAYISPSLQEDFGMLNLEVNAGGTPVIAYRSGGATETIVEGKTGLFFVKPTVDSLALAVEKFNRLTFNPRDCIKQAKKFSKRRFKREMKKFIEFKLKD
jgi:glycosyltransferase involved in cell wall biosynthesis